MKPLLWVYFMALCVAFAPSLAQADNWIEFHTENWSQKSGKQKKKILYTISYFYDAESRVTVPAGDMTLWVKEVTHNDILYVKKGDPEIETIYRKVHLWCSKGRYEILQPDTDDGKPNELISEAIKPGSYYDRLRKAVCRSDTQ